MLGISPFYKNAVVYNLSITKKETTNEIKEFCKYSLPYALAGLVFNVLQEASLSTPAPVVANYVSNSMYACIGLCVLKAAYNMAKSNEKLYGQKKDVTHIVLTKEEFTFMENEITRLKQEIEEANRKLNFKPILDRLA